MDIAQKVKAIDKGTRKSIWETIGIETYYATPKSINTENIDTVLCTIKKFKSIMEVSKDDCIDNSTERRHKESIMAYENAYAKLSEIFWDYYNENIRRKRKQLQSMSTQALCGGGVYTVGKELGYVGHSHTTIKGRSL